MCSNAGEVSATLARIDQLIVGYDLTNAGWRMLRHELDRLKVMIRDDAGDAERGELQARQ